LRSKFKDGAKQIPWEAVGAYNYLQERVGLQQLMAGARKWKLSLINREDLIALTERAAKGFGIPLPEEAELDAIERFLD